MRYETKEDLDAELKVKALIEARTKSVLYKLPIKYGADYIAIRREIPAAIVEIKVRGVTMDAYMTYMISLHKVITVLNYSEAIGVPFLLFVQWTNVIGRKVITREDLAKVEMQKVNFRNDPDDIEPCVMIPIEKFSLL